MAFSQPLFENKQDLYPNQFMSGFEEPEFQNNQPLTQTPSINPNNMKRAAMNFAMTPPPNLQKINPMQRTPVQNQKPSLNNTPNVMNQINQMRIPSKNPNMQMRINQAQMSYNETKMKNVKSANFSVNMYDPQAQIQMNFPSNQPNNQNMNHPLPQKMSFSPQNCVYFNNNVNFSSNENISKMESPDDQQKVMSMKLSMNSINQNKNKNQPININPSKESKDKPQFNLNINSQPFAVSYSFNCTPNMANSKTQSVEADISEKIQNKLGFWTNSESMQKTTSQVNLNRNFGSYDLDSEKQIRSENQSPLMQSKEDFNATVLKLDNELAKKLNLERENENHSEGFFCL